MVKTVFTSGQRVGAEWFNAIQHIQFDDASMDGHYARLTDAALTNAPGNIKSEFYSFRDKLLVVAGTNPLTINVTPGVVVLANGQNIVIPLKEVLLSANTTQFIVINKNGDVIATPTPPTEGVFLAKVSTSNKVDTITDLRPRQNYQVSPLTQPNLQSFVMPSGVIIPYVGVSLPAGGWLWCDGSEYAPTTYPDLFNVIGYRYGQSGINFRLPDVRKRNLRFAGQDLAIGQYGGVDTVSMTIANMPYHTHTLYDPGHSHGVYDPGHSHNITDPGHAHGLNLKMGGSDGSGVGDIATNTDKNQDFINQAPTGFSPTGIGIQGSGSNISVYGSNTGLGIEHTGGGQPMTIINPFVSVNALIKI